MAILSIRRYPDPVVREATRPVERVDGELRSLGRSMIETMHEAQGVGLAANQVGIQQRIIVVEIDDVPHVFINPEIIEKSEKTERGEEGCLSLISQVHIPIERSVKVTVEALDQRGRPVVMEAEGLLARIFQHEIDHLNGFLIIDRASDEDRKKVLKEIVMSDVEE